MYTYKPMIQINIGGCLVCEMKWFITILLRVLRLDKLKTCLRCMISAHRRAASVLWWPVADAVYFLHVRTLSFFLTPNVLYQLGSRS
jgi:hypothetical protein